MHKSLCGAFALVCLLIPDLSVAEPILRATASTVSIEGGPTCTSQTTITGATTSSATANCAVTVPYEVFGIPGISHQSATATASFGALTAVAEEGYDIEVGIEFYELLATAEFTDGLTIFGDSGTGFLQYRFSGLIGSASSDFFNPDVNSELAISHAGGPLVLAVNGAGTFEAGHGLSGPGEVIWSEQDFVGDALVTPFVYTTPLLPFVWGEEFELYVYGRAITQILFDCCGYGYLDATLEGIDVFDAQGQLSERANRVRSECAVCDADSGTDDVPVDWRGVGRCDAAQIF